MITGLFIVLRFFGGYGVWGIVISTIILAGYILWVRRKQFIWTLKQIEALLWGKPFDEMDKEEIKNLKLKVKRDGKREPGILEEE